MEFLHVFLVALWFGLPPVSAGGRRQRLHGIPSLIDDLETKLDAAVSRIEKLENELAKCCGKRKLTHFTLGLNNPLHGKFIHITIHDRFLHINNNNRDNSNNNNNRSLNVRKHTIGHVRPAMIQISLHTRSVESQSSLAVFWINKDAFFSCRQRRI